MCIIPLETIHKEAQWGSLVPFRETWRGLEFPKLFLRSEFSFCWSLGVLLPDAPPPGLTSPSAHPTSWFPLGLEAGRITMTSPPTPNVLCNKIWKAVSLARMKLSVLLMPNDCHPLKPHGGVPSRQCSHPLSFQVQGRPSHFLETPRCVLQLFKALRFTYCTCVIKDPVKSSDFLCFCPGLWRK